MYHKTYTPKEIHETYSNVFLYFLSSSCFLFLSPSFPLHYAVKLFSIYFAEHWVFPICDRLFHPGQVPNRRLHKKHTGTENQ